jgi:hypothetical protein
VIREAVNLAPKISWSRGDTPNGKTPKDRTYCRFEIGTIDLGMANFDRTPFERFSSLKRIGGFFSSGGVIIFYLKPLSDVELYLNYKFLEMLSRIPAEIVIR